MTHGISSECSNALVKKSPQSISFGGFSYVSIARKALLEGNRLGFKRALAVLVDRASFLCGCDLIRIEQTIVIDIHF